MSHQPESSQQIAVICPVSTIAEAVAAARAGAAFVDAGDDESLVYAIREAGIDVLVCGPGEAATLGRDQATANLAGTDLVCVGLAAAEHAVREGVRRDRVVVQVTAQELAAITPAGWRTLVDVDVDAGLAGKPPAEAAARAEAVAAVCAWLGASLIRTRQVTEIRRCLDMTESVIGRRPPAWAVRGLA